MAAQHGQQVPQDPDSRADHDGLLAGRLHELALSQDIGAADLSGDEPALQQLEHCLIRLDLLLDQSELLMCLDKLIPGAGDLGGECQGGRAIVGKRGRGAEALCLDAGFNPAPEVDFVGGLQPQLEERLSLLVARPFDRGMPCAHDPGDVQRPGRPCAIDV